MKLAITSIQRNRGPWIVEWLAFHMMVGFNQFYIYCHKCDDGQVETLLKLSQHYPIKVYGMESDDKPQLAAYQHAWAHHKQEVDWMAFIDGDEFLFSPSHANIGDALAEFAGHPLSALGVYWVCYGSSGHMTDPGGLIVEKFTRHSDYSFLPNRHIKSIVRGRQDIEIVGSHLFATPNGTYDEQLRLLESPLLQDPAQAPSHARLRINHYVTQSYDFFKKTKQNMGAADISPSAVRPDEWFHNHDRNECDDGMMYNFLIRLKLKVQELQAALAA
jgi:hypothetical protein